MNGLWLDLRFAFRALRRHPAFATVALLTLALGTGVTVALFAAVHAVLLRPLPFADPGRLVYVSEANPQQGVTGEEVSYPNLQDLKAATRTMTGLGGYLTQEVRVRLGTATARVSSILGTPELFSVLGVQPRLGRLPTADAGDYRTVVLSYGYWQRELGGDASALGKILSIEGLPYTVIGVMPASFEFPGPEAQFWMPTGAVPSWWQNRAVHVFGVVGRLRPGVGLDGLRQELAAVSANIQRRAPGEDPGHHLEAMPLRNALVSGVRPALLLLFGAAGLVLLIACGNIGGVQLARMAAREEELAVRGALGAGRGRLVRQLLAENLILALLGGAGGVVLAFWIVRWLTTHAAAVAAVTDRVPLSAAPLAFTLALSLAVGVLVAVPGVLRASRGTPAEALRGAPGRTTASGRRRRARGILVVAEIGLAVVLVTGAGLLLQSFSRLLHVDPGFRPDHLLTVGINLPADQYSDAARVIGFYRDLPDQLTRIPGVAAASAVSTLPISGGEARGDLTIESRPFAPGATPSATFRRVLPNYFRTIGIPLVAGREFTDNDQGDPFVVLINASMAQQYWGSADRALGHRIKVGPAETEPWLTIVGVVGDVRNERLEEEDQYATYEPLAQRPRRTMIAVLRTAVPPLSVAPAVRSALTTLDPNLLLYDIQSMDRRMSASVAPRRFNTQLLAAFGALALGLAALGIYGLMAQVVGERRRELGIRMALGASPASLHRLVLSQGLALVGAGVALGLAGALAVAHLLAGLLYDTSTLDPLPLAATALLLASASLVALIVPARRAARLDPMGVMRAE